MNEIFCVQPLATLKDHIHRWARYAGLVNVGKINPRIAIGSLITLFIVIVAGGNCYYRVYLQLELPVSDFQPDARVTEKEINQARSLRGLGVQLLKDNQERLCQETLLRAKVVMKM